MIKEVDHRPEMATFKYRVIGPVMEHNYYCPVCREKSAVISSGILQPCWGCQKKDYVLIKKNWFLKLFIK